jgi:hypothetical protein
MEPTRPGSSHGPPPLPSRGNPSRSGLVHPLGYGRKRPTAAEPTDRPSFFHQAAKASWVAPLVALLLGFCTLDFRRQPENRDAALAIGIVNVLLIVAGAVLAVAALFGVGKHGTAGILGPAILGLIINGFLVFSLFMLFNR